MGSRQGGTGGHRGTQSTARHGHGPHHTAGPVPSDPSAAPRALIDPSSPHVVLWALRVPPLPPERADAGWGGGEGRSPQWSPCAPLAARSPPACVWPGARAGPASPRAPGRPQQGRSAPADPYRGGRACGAGGNLSRPPPPRRACQRELPAGPSNGERPKRPAQPCLSAAVFRRRLRDGLGGRGRGERDAATHLRLCPRPPERGGEGGGRPAPGRAAPRCRAGNGRCGRCAMRPRPCLYGGERAGLRRRSARLCTERQGVPMAGRQLGSGCDPAARSPLRGAGRGAGGEGAERGQDLVGRVWRCPSPVRCHWGRPRCCSTPCVGMAVCSHPRLGGTEGSSPLRRVPIDAPWLALSLLTMLICPTPPSRGDEGHYLPRWLSASVPPIPSRGSRTHGYQNRIPLLTNVTCTDHA